jgi:hypothetical protein
MEDKPTGSRFKAWAFGVDWNWIIGVFLAAEFLAGVIILLVLEVDPCSDSDSERY